MATKNRFIIKRKDSTDDDVVIESEGLTIGRLIGNDLLLNHRSVSRTHAGIKEAGGDFWLFNLSTSNGTLLNGELVDKAPLEDGDVIQLGRYLLQVKYLQNALALTVEMEMEQQPLEGRTTLLHTPGGDESQVGTALLHMPGTSTVTRGGTRRLEGTGLLTGMLPGLDEQALKVFWDKRKREAGKIAEKTPLHPRGPRRVGKSQFNWRPTLDLRKLWRKSYFSWGVIIVAVLAIAALFIHSDAYSPGEISDVHKATTVSEQGLAFAARANGGSCAECHTATQAIETKCASCHQTETFTPAISKVHTDSGLNCSSCHGDHMWSYFNHGNVGSAM